MISVSAADGASSDEITAAITSLMRERRNLGPNEDNNFSIMDTRQIADTLSNRGHPIAGITADRLLSAGRPNGILYGPRSPKYQKDGSPAP
jgi:hypothetical protein